MKPIEDLLTEDTEDAHHKGFVIEHVDELRYYKSLAKRYRYYSFMLLILCLFLLAFLLAIPIGGIIVAEALGTAIRASGVTP